MTMREHGIYDHSPDSKSKVISEIFHCTPLEIQKYCCGLKLFHRDAQIHIAHQIDVAHHDTSWKILMVIETLFVFIAFHDRSLTFMMYTQKSWKIMMVIETVMMYHELLRCFTNPYGKILKDFANNHEKTWSIMIWNITFWRGRDYHVRLVNLLM